MYLSRLCFLVVASATALFACKKNDAQSTAKDINLSTPNAQGVLQAIGRFVEKPDRAQILFEGQMPELPQISNQSVSSELFYKAFLRVESFPPDVTPLMSELEIRQKSEQYTKVSAATSAALARMADAKSRLAEGSSDHCAITQANQIDTSINGDLCKDIMRAFLTAYQFQHTTEVRFGRTDESKLTMNHQGRTYALNVGFKLHPKYERLIGCIGTIKSYRAVVALERVMPYEGKSKTETGMFMRVVRSLVPWGSPHQECGYGWLFDMTKYMENMETSS